AADEQLGWPPRDPHQRRSQLDSVRRAQPSVGIGRRDRPTGDWLSGTHDTLDIRAAGSDRADRIDRLRCPPPRQVLTKQGEQDFGGSSGSKSFVSVVLACVRGVHDTFDHQPQWYASVGGDGGDGGRLHLYSGDLSLAHLPLPLPYLSVG